MPIIVDYIEARMVKSPHLSVDKMEMQELLPHKKFIAFTGYQYGTAELPIWTDKARVIKEMFKPVGFPKKFRLCYFDIPGIADMSKASENFFKVLADSD